MLDDYKSDADRKYIELANASFAEEKIPPTELTTTCPECGMEPAEPDTDEYHEFIENTRFVLIGCEGYHIINPNLVGVPRPNWCDWKDEF